MQRISYMFIPILPKASSLKDRNPGCLLTWFYDLLPEILKSHAAAGFVIYEPRSKDPEKTISWGEVEMTLHIHETL